MTIYHHSLCFLFIYIYIYIHTQTESCRMISQVWNINKKDNKDPTQILILLWGPIFVILFCYYFALKIISKCLPPHATRYIIKEWFIFILILFRWIYFIIQFGKALSHLVQFYACAQRIWQSPFVIINPYTGNGAWVWMTSCQKRWSREVENFEKESVEIGPLRQRVGFWPLKDVVGFFGSLPTEILDITRCAAHWGGVSIGF